MTHIIKISLNDGGFMCQIFRVSRGDLVVFGATTTKKADMLFANVLIAVRVGSVSYPEQSTRTHRLDGKNLRNMGSCKC